MHMNDKPYLKPHIAKMKHLRKHYLSEVVTNWYNIHSSIKLHNGRLHSDAYDNNTYTVPIKSTNFAFLVSYTQKIKKLISTTKNNQSVAI